MTLTVEQYVDAESHSYFIIFPSFPQTAIKLDFKTNKAVDPSLDILVKKASQVNVNRPVWLNADILKGPNVPINIAVNASL